MSGYVTNLLLVEGKDDLHVIRNLWFSREKTTDAFTVEWPRGGDPESGGKEALLESLPTWLKTEGLEHLGVVLDADEQVKSTWQAVADRLNRAGYHLPMQPDSTGLVLDHPTGDGPRVGVWLMPDNSLPGKLEDFVRMLIPADDSLAIEAESILSKIEEKKIQRYAPKDRPKAFIHTWLSWQEEPGKPMGTAITRKYLDPSSAQANVFVTWLRRLFIENAKHKR